MLIATQIDHNGNLSKTFTGPVQFTIEDTTGQDVLVVYIPELMMDVLMDADQCTIQNVKLN